LAGGWWRDWLTGNRVGQRGALYSRGAWELLRAAGKAVKCLVGGKLSLKAPRLIALAAFDRWRAFVLFDECGLQSPLSCSYVT